MDVCRIALTGNVTNAPRLSHELYGEHFYQGVLAVPRLSGAIDELPFIMPEKYVARVQAGGPVGLEGQIRSYRRLSDDNVRLQLMIFVRSVGPPADEGVNEVEIAGTLLRDPSVRRTPLGREIADLLVTIERPHGKKDCVPCIAWGKHAHACACLAAGSRIHLLGRLQSRLYQKEQPDGTVQDRTTYEVSVGNVLESS